MSNYGLDKMQLRKYFSYISTSMTTPKAERSENKAERCSAEKLKKAERCSAFERSNVQPLVYYILLFIID